MYYVNVLRLYSLILIQVPHHFDLIPFNLIVCVCVCVWVCECVKSRVYSAIQSNTTITRFKFDWIHVTR